MIYEALTRSILEACFEVSNELGIGSLESVCERALFIALQEKGLAVRAQAPMKVGFRGQEIGVFFADLFVEEAVIVELEAVKMLVPEHRAQLINYLSAAGIEIGQLINFGTSKLEYKRIYQRTA